MKVLQIMEGELQRQLSNTPLANKEVEQLSELRMKHCRSCRINNEPGLKDSRCTVCGCFMERKTRALNATCPVGKW